MTNDASALDIDEMDDVSYESEIDSTQSEEQFIEPEIENNDNDLTDRLLNLQGITDKNKIKFEDESGAVVEKSWDSLSNDEKLMILSHQEDPDTSLDASEIELINQIRESGLTPDQYIQNLTRPEPPVASYEVDSMTDDELYCLDLLDKVGSENITDEELHEALEKAKSNENIYNKQVASLRVYYKNLEDQAKQREEEERQLYAEQQYAQFSNQVVDAIKNFNTLNEMPVELSYEEKEDLANYILTQDASGQSEFSNMLNNPNQLIQAAFWMLKGPEILNELQNQIKEAYLRGYNETHQTNKVFVKPSSKPTNNNKESQFANFDEDSYLNT